MFKYDCIEDTLNIGELYAVKNSIIYDTPVIASYDSNKDEIEHVSSPFIWERRANLSKVTLINTVLEWDKFYYSQDIKGITKILLIFALYEI